MQSFIILLSSLAILANPLQTSSAANQLTYTNEEFQQNYTEINDFNFKNKDMQFFTDKTKEYIQTYYNNHAIHSVQIMDSFNYQLEKYEVSSVYSLNKLVFEQMNEPGGGSSQTITSLKEITDYDESNIAVSSYGPILSGYEFIGVSLSKEFCIKVYNMVVRWCTNKVFGLDSYVNQIISILNYTSIALASVGLTSILAPIFQAVTSALLVVIPYLKPLIVVVGLALIAVLSSALYAGVRKKGYYVGFYVRVLPLDIIPVGDFYE